MTTPPGGSLAVSIPEVDAAAIASQVWAQEPADASLISAVARAVWNFDNPPTGTGKPARVMSAQVWERNPPAAAGKARAVLTADAAADVLAAFNTAERAPTAADVLAAFYTAERAPTAADVLAAFNTAERAPTAAEVLAAFNTAERAPTAAEIAPRARFTVLTVPADTLGTVRFTSAERTANIVSITLTPPRPSVFRVLGLIISGGAARASNSNQQAGFSYSLRAGDNELTDISDPSDLREGYALTGSDAVTFAVAARSPFGGNSRIGVAPTLGLLVEEVGHA